MGGESCRKITRHPLVMSSGTTTSLPLSRRDGGSGRGGPRDFSA